MDTITSETKQKNSLYSVIALCGISLVIIIHECGHFLSARLFNVPVTTFSLGFGPALFSTTFHNTIFQIALIPIGGYVSMDPVILASKPYIQKMIIVLAGILFNFIFAYLILLFYRTKKKSILPLIKQLFTQEKNRTFIGPIGIFKIIKESIAINTQLFWTILAIISFNIGLFNLIPLPIFDGGQALFYTLEALSNKTISASMVWFITIIVIIFIMFVIHKKQRKKEI